jgi:hypothetical protein
VRTTLGEDDKVVRELLRDEVLKTPLSSLDAKWPREIGAQAGEGAPARECENESAEASAKPRAKQVRTIELAPKRNRTAACARAAADCVARAATGKRNSKRRASCRRARRWPSAKRRCRSSR